jgi:hypothetical protein
MVFGHVRYEPAKNTKNNRPETMKLIAASIMTFAAAILIVGGAHVVHDGTKLFVMTVGCVVGLTGLGGWFAGIKER